jgi:hypothetical protein
LIINNLTKQLFKITILKPIKMTKYFLTCLLASALLTVQVIAKPKSALKFSSTSIDYGLVLKNSEREQKVLFTNKGDKTVTITKIMSVSNRFTVTPKDMVVKAGETSFIIVNYNTDIEGYHKEKVYITTDENGFTEQILKVSAHVVTSLSSGLKFNQSVLDFGNIGMSSSTTLNASFTNTTNKPITIHWASAKLDWNVKTSLAKKTILPGESTFVAVEYQPSKMGAFSSQIELTTDERVLENAKLYLKGNVVGERQVSVAVAPPVTPNVSFQERNFSQWYSAEIKKGQILYCRYRPASDNRIELELQCNYSYSFEVTAKTCSSTSDTGNGWHSVRVGGKTPTTLYLDETSQGCENGFWWWVRNFRFTGAVCIQD